MLYETYLKHRQTDEQIDGDTHTQTHHIQLLNGYSGSHPIVLALQRLGQEDYEFGATLNSTIRSCLHLNKIFKN